MTFYDDLFHRFQELHSDIANAIDGLPPEALDWVPGPEMNSIAVLVVHLTGSERYWIGDVALGDPSGRVRDDEFKVRGLTVEQLRQRLSVADDYARAAFARFTLVDLETDRKSPRNDKIFTVGWSLLHALEHTGLHTGHIQLTRQLWIMKE
ncbi:DinB family protein [bacterium]|nr:DinB family protein [bacterium]